MITSSVEDAVVSTVERIVDACSPERIWLFGSRVRDEAGPGSDWDLLATVPDGQRAAAHAATRSLPPVGDASVDLHVMERTDFLSKLQLRASFPSTVVREGRIVYEREPLSDPEANALMEQALGDLAVARTLSEGDEAHIRACLYHLQQAAEKAAKALLAQHDIPYEREHDFRYLARLLRPEEPELAERVHALAGFARYAQELRYPESAVDPPDRSDVTDALTSVTELVSALDGRVRSLQAR